MWNNMPKKKTNNQFVTSPEQLKELIAEGHTEYTLVLGGGVAHSRKEINYNKKTKKFKIINYIDDSHQTLSEAQLMNRDYTHIGEAMPLNSLICIIN